MSTCVKTSKLTPAASQHDLLGLSERRWYYFLKSSCHMATAAAAMHCCMVL